MDRNCQSDVVSTRYDWLRHSLNDTCREVIAEMNDQGFIRSLFHCHLALSLIFSTGISLLWAKNAQIITNFSYFSLQIKFMAIGIQCIRTSFKQLYTVWILLKIAYCEKQTKILGYQFCINKRPLLQTTVFRSRFLKKWPPDITQFPDRTPKVVEIRRQ